MEPAQVGRLLKATPVLAGLSEEDLEELGGSCRVRQVRRGQILFAEGDPADFLLVVASGRLRVLVTSPEGGELVLSVIGPGDSLGEIGCFDGGVRSAAVEALSDSTVVQLPARELLALVERRPQVARDLLTEMAGHLRRLTGVTADLVFLDVPRRVAKLLAKEFQADSSPELELAETQSQLGARIGGTRQSVNAALRTLERRGWIEVSGRHISVRDLAALRHFADS
ncbi:MAG TPA: Crp/Fnr family transcriptional regulator [Candidatus Dormibacteraeota bacterium]